MRKAILPVFVVLGSAGSSLAFFPDVVRVSNAATSASQTLNELVSYDLGQVNFDVSGPTLAQGGSRAIQNSVFNYSQIPGTIFQGSGNLSVSASALSPFSAVASSTILMTFDVDSPVGCSLSFNPGFPIGLAPSTMKLRLEDNSPDGYQTVYSRATTPGTFNGVLNPGRYEFSLELRAVRSGSPFEPITSSVNTTFALSITEVPAPGASGVLLGVCAFASRRRRAPGNTPTQNRNSSYADVAPVQEGA